VRIPGLTGVPAAIHDRMPVILAERDAQDAWLDQRLRRAPEALQLCGALAAERMSASPSQPPAPLNKGDPSS